MKIWNEQSGPKDVSKIGWEAFQFHKRRWFTEYLNKYPTLNNVQNIEYCTQCNRNFYHCTTFRGRILNVVSTYLFVTDVKPFVDADTLAFHLRRIVPGTVIRIFPCINHYTASSYAFHSATNLIFQQTDISSVPKFGTLNFFWYSDTHGYIHRPMLMPYRLTGWLWCKFYSDFFVIIECTVTITSMANRKAWKLMHDSA